MEQLRTAFIEGTNEQYSIREDGIVMGYFNRFGNPYKEPKILKRNRTFCGIYVKGKQKRVFINKSLIKYFNHFYCDRCGKKCECIKKVSMRFLCDTCKIPKKVSQETYKIAHPEKFKETHNISSRKKSKNITRAYVAGVLRMSIKDLTNELYNLYKAQLQIKRLISQKTGIPTVNIRKYVKNQKLLHPNRPNA